MPALKRLLLATAVATLLVGCAGFNRYQETGVLSMAHLGEPVRVVRDEKGMPYIYAHTLEDAYRAMGFVTAQDRLFQMELTRMMAAGRIAELAGEQALPLDRRMRTIGIARLARRHARRLPQDAGRYFRHYLEGVNAFVVGHADDHHLEFKLAGIRPAPWSVADVLSVMYLMSWNTSANIQTEILTQMLIDRLGADKARTLFPLHTNPDEEAVLPTAEALLPTAHSLPGIAEGDPLLRGYLETGALGLGSNNWVAGPALSPGGKPILANDPHLDARMLPGPWYPCGLFTPGLRIVGAHIPGLPVMPVFRSDAVAAGITNAYADVQDLYIETLDPADGGRYLEGDRSIPFGILQETLRYRDDALPGGFGQETLTIRLTRRGPIISDVFPDLDTRRVLSLRWAAAEIPDAGGDFTLAMQARSAADFREALRHWKTILLNFVFADREGHIGWQVSGAVPIRAGRDGTVPQAVTDGQDSWVGWIPFTAMPQADDPEAGWIGTCNHKTVSSDYPYYYSSYFASSYRYRRLKALMSGRSVIGADEHWRFQRDTRNVMAAAIVPVMAPILSARPETRALGDILAAWDCEDRAEDVAPTLFHALHDRWAWHTFEDELGEPLARAMLGGWYFWQERFQAMVQAGQSPWFDDIATRDIQESKEDMLYRAAEEVRRDLAARLGDDLSEWRWGRVHTITFLHPLRRSGMGQGLLGGGRHPLGGSGETLHRGQYAFGQPFEVTYGAALRMVADLDDSDKVLAVIPGGVSGRMFHPHAKDQLTPFIEGEKHYWWFSDRAIEDHMRSELRLIPLKPAAEARGEKTSWR